jgi:hypothetical protein
MGDAISIANAGHPHMRTAQGRAAARSRWSARSKKHGLRARRHMHIVLFRHGIRALFSPVGQKLIDCPPRIRLRPGGPVTKDRTTLTMDTPMPGIDLSRIFTEIQQHGFCALREDECPPGNPRG